MAGLPVWQTRLEQLVRQLHWTVGEFRAQFAAASRRLADAGQGEPVTVSQRTVERWYAGKLTGLPYPSACRVLEQLFGEPVQRLFGPPEPAPAVQVAPTAQQRQPVVEPEPGSAGGLGLEREVMMAASESARFTQFAEQSNVGPHTVEQFRDDIARIVANYGNRPIYPTFVEVRELRDRAFELLEGRQRPEHTRDLYLVAGLLCAILGNASKDLGLLTAATAQYRTAFMCAELAGVNWLRAWVRAAQSSVAYWEDRPRAAVELVADGWQYTPETGTVRVSLASLEARARARLRDHRSTEDALARADHAREAVPGDDELGSMFALPVHKQSWYAATARLWLGGQANNAEALRLAGNAVELYEAAPPEQRQLGELCLARLDLAAAHLGRDDLEGTAASIGEVLAIATQRRTDSITRRLQQLARLLERPRYQTTGLALSLRDEIRAFAAPPTVPSLAEGS